MAQFSGMPMSTGDSGSAQTGVTLPDGSQVGVGANVTVGHSVLIILVAIALLWLLGGVVFRTVRTA